MEMLREPPKKRNILEERLHKEQAAKMEEINHNCRRPCVRYLYSYPFICACVCAFVCLCLCVCVNVCVCVGVCMSVVGVPSFVLKMMYCSLKIVQHMK